MGEGHGLLPFVIQPAEEDDAVTTHTGLPLVIEAFRGYRGDDLVTRHLKLKKRQRGCPPKKGPPLAYMADRPFERKLR